MSGGSYEYICVADVDDLLNKLNQVQRMSDRLAGLGYADDAASETQDLLLTCRQFRNRIETMHRRLEEVWKAVEWWDSGDFGEEDVKLALIKYRKGLL